MAGSTCITTNGHVLDGRPKIPWMMPLQLLVGGPGGRLTDVSDRAGAPFRAPHLGRGLAVGDLDNDGPSRRHRAQPESTAGLSAQPSKTAGHFIRFSLEGTDRIGMPSGLVSRSPSPGDASCPSASAEAATSRRTIPGCISAWALRLGGHRRGAVAVGTGRSPWPIGRRPRISASRGRAASRGREPGARTGIGRRLASDRRKGPMGPRSVFGRGPERHGPSSDFSDGKSPGPHWPRLKRTRLADRRIHC